jgi:four helix bundle protein
MTVMKVPSAQSPVLSAKALPFARNFHDLLVYQKARKLQQEIFRQTKSFPREEMFSLTDQIRRASRSIGAQIAEAWAKRDYERHFASKLTDADGEQMETQHWITTSVDCEYISRERGVELFNASLEIGRILGAMKRRAADFCPDGTTLRELPDEFFTASQLSTED